MCTVTFIPVNRNIFLTSNRDEKQKRFDALVPKIYQLASGRIMYPKDSDAGGSWIAFHENGNAVVLLNGGTKAHLPIPPYRRSRGLILLDMIEGASLYKNFLDIKLNNVEPFTAVLWENHHLYECLWDGEQKHTKQLDERKPYIWSSVTLYDEEAIVKRNKWFNAWITGTPSPGLNDIHYFHQYAGDGDSHNDLRMNRNGEVCTVSITSLSISDSKATMLYLDLKNNKQAEETLLFEKSMAS